MRADYRDGYWIRVCPRCGGEAASWCYTCGRLGFIRATCEGCDSNVCQYRVDKGHFLLDQYFCKDCFRDRRIREMRMARWGEMHDKTMEALIKCE